jgi:hypothetical protein
MPQIETLVMQHSKAFDHACFLVAFDLLELEGEDWRAVACF